MSREEQRWERMRAQSREQILAAALEVFGDRSFAEGTIAEVAAQAGVSKGLVFNYFPTKDALLQALVEKMMSEALDFWDAQPWSGSPAERLTHWVDGAVGQALRRPGFYRLYFSLALQPGGSAAVERALANLQPRLELYLQRAETIFAEAGSADPALDARLLQCAINGLAQVIVTGPGLVGEEGLVRIEPLRRRLIEMFLPADPRR